MATIKEVAEEAGLAVGTVSRVLNNRGYISEKAKQKVYDAMAKLDYQPNELARSLQNKHSNVIGVIVPHIIHPYFAEVINCIEESAYKKGFRIILCNSQNTEEKEDSYVQILKANRAAGIIIFTGGSRLKSFESLKTPVVAMECYPEYASTVVACDNTMGGTLAGEHLMEKGCKHILLITSTPNGPMPSSERETAFYQACKEKYIPVQTLMTAVENFEALSYMMEIKDYLSKHPEVDGIFTTSDVIAAQAIRACHMLKKRVPEDVKIIGYDDVKMAAYYNPPITTIHQPIGKMAELAVELLLKVIEEESVEEKYLLPVSLVQRETT